MDRQKRKRKKIISAIKYAVAAAVVAAVTIGNLAVPYRSLLPARAIAAQDEGELRIYFLDVGQGDCSVVSFPDGRALVIDAGNGGWLNENMLIRFFNGLKPTSLTYVATHADTDHCGGIATLVEYFGAETVYLPAIPAETSRYQEMLTAAEERGATMKQAKRYEVLDYGSAYAVFLAPYSFGEEDDNDSSAVLYLRYGETTALFTGDITAARETRLVNEYHLMPNIFDSGKYAVRLDDVDILKVAHHGSNASSSAEWLDLIRPEVSVISCKRDNRYGHPRGGTLQRLTDCGSEIYRIDELGDICVSAYPDGTYKVLWD